MECNDCTYKLAKRLVSNHSSLSWLEALEYADRGLSRINFPHDPNAPNPCSGPCGSYGSCAGEAYDFRGSQKSNSSLVCYCFSGQGCSVETDYWKCNSNYQYNGTACVYIPTESLTEYGSESLLLSTKKLSEYTTESQVHHKGVFHTFLNKVGAVHTKTSVHHVFRYLYEYATESVKKATVSLSEYAKELSLSFHVALKLIQSSYESVILRPTILLFEHAIESCTDATVRLLQYVTEIARGNNIIEIFEYSIDYLRWDFHHIFTESLASHQVWYKRLKSRFSKYSRKEHPKQVIRRED